MPIDIVGLMSVLSACIHHFIACADTAYTILLPFHILGRMRIPLHIQSQLYSSQVGFNDGKVEITLSKWSGMEILLFGT
jgi:hypothetical protein